MIPVHSEYRLQSSCPKDSRYHLWPVSTSIASPLQLLAGEEIVEGSVEAELLSAEEWSIKESGGSTISWWAIRVGIILKPLDKDIRGVNIKEHPNGALEIRISHLQFEEATLADIVDLKWVLLLLGEGISEGDIVPWIQCQRLAAGPTVSDSTHEDPTEIEWSCSQCVAVEEA